MLSLKARLLLSFLIGEAWVIFSYIYAIGSTAPYGWAATHGNVPFTIPPSTYILMLPLTMSDSLGNHLFGWDKGPIPVAYQGYENFFSLQLPFLIGPFLIGVLLFFPLIRKHILSTNKRVAPVVPQAHQKNKKRNRKLS